jgi:hypothetical protein
MKLIDRIRTKFRRKKRLDDPTYFELTRADLNPTAAQIYEKLRPKLKITSQAQLRMLVMYAVAGAELKEAGRDRALTAHLARVQLYARNGLVGLDGKRFFRPTSIDLGDLIIETIIDGHDKWPCCCLGLDPSWQFWDY